MEVSLAVIAFAAKYKKKRSKVGAERSYEYGPFMTVEPFRVIFHCYGTNKFLWLAFLCAYPVQRDACDVIALCVHTCMCANGVALLFLLQ